MYKLKLISYKLSPLYKLKLISYKLSPNYVEVKTYKL
jgi:hypothetical protein